MSYIDKKLTENEYIIYKTKLHWLVMIKPLSTLLFLIIAFLGIESFHVFSYLPREVYQYKNIVYFVIFFFVFLFPFISKLIVKISTEIGITNQRLLNKTGFISIHMQGMPLSKIETIDSRQSILGRLFGFGDVVIKGSGSTPIVLRNISKPLKFRSELATLTGTGN